MPLAHHELASMMLVTVITAVTDIDMVFTTMLPDVK